MKCALCSCDLPTGDSAWGVYFDTCHEGNIWGGDTFQTRAYLCSECGERLQAQGGVEVEDEVVH